MIEQSPRFTEMFDELLKAFQANKSAARLLHSPNLEDSFLVKLAIVGFSYHCATESWSKPHYDFLSVKLNAGTNEGLFDNSKMGGENVAAFHALCLGYLLGMYQVGKLTGNQFSLAEIQLPGFIALRLPEIDQSI